MEAVAGRNHVDIRLRMRKPRIGKRRTIGVVGKNVRRARKLLQLYKQTFPAYVDVQRIEWFHAIQLFWLHIGICQRRHAEVDEGMLQLRPARSTHGLRHINRLLTLDSSIQECRSDVRSLEAASA